MSSNTTHIGKTIQVLSKKKDELQEECMELFLQVEDLKEENILLRQDYKVLEKKLAKSLRINVLTVALLGGMIVCFSFDTVAKLVHTLFA